MRKGAHRALNGEETAARARRSLMRAGQSAEALGVQASKERVEPGFRPGDDDKARELLLKARLSSLLASLGGLPVAFSTPAASGGVTSTQGLAVLLDEVCPEGCRLLHGKKIPGGPGDLGHLVVAPRGLVVVGPQWVPVRVRVPHLAPLGPEARPGEGPAVPAGGLGTASGGGGATPATAGAAFRSKRSAVVRGALQRSQALHDWLSGTSWASTPVLAVVCSPPVIGRPPPVPVLLDHLWVGPLGRLSHWLVSGTSLDGAECEELGDFLLERLPGEAPVG